MATKKQLEAKIKKYKALLSGEKTEKKIVSRTQQDIEASRLESEIFFKKKLGLDIVKRNLKVELPVKAGTKTYEGVEFSNGKIGVWTTTRWGTPSLKYAWDKPILKK